MTEASNSTASELPKLDYDDPEFSKAAKEVKGARHAGLTNIESDRSLYTTLAALRIRERQLVEALSSRHRELPERPKLFWEDPARLGVLITRGLESNFNAYVRVEDFYALEARIAQREEEIAELKGPPQPSQAQGKVWRKKWWKAQENHAG